MSGAMPVAPVADSLDRIVARMDAEVERALRERSRVGSWSIQSLRLTCNEHERSRGCDGNAAIN